MKKRETAPPAAVPMPPPDPSLADKLASPTPLSSATAATKQVCRVCGGPGASRRDDQLCWVCRRLKISAWRDVEKLGGAE